ncbi:MerR family transcriptional regulator [Methyloraptor flagellatus]|jgi:DNA-binding transcriptional MerR regulator|uniref:MerR family transcriptional regulator n=1 Tax=Methyloraptor flagellatus TaxID=3162530 RepID=A0AAU7X7F2_9HYPH
MMIGDLARATGLSVDTLRWYEKIGLIRKPARDRGGRRVYPADTLDWIAFLGRLKSTGMSIAEMLDYARLREQGPATTAARRVMLERHRIRVRDDIAALTASLGALDDKIETYRAIEAGLAADRDPEIAS